MTPPRLIGDRAYDRDSLDQSLAVRGQVFYFFILCLLLTPFVTFAQSSSAFPKVAITRLSTEPVDDVLFYIRVTFSEAVTGFTSRDLKIVGGVLNSFQQIGTTTYAAAITPAKNFKGDLTIKVPENVAKNAANKGNFASPTFTVNIPHALVRIEDVTTHNGGSFVAGYYYYEDHIKYITTEVGFREQFGEECDHVKENTWVLRSYVWHYHKVSSRRICTPMDLSHPGVPSFVSIGDIDGGLQGANTFPAQYVENRGGIVSTTIDDVPVGLRTHLTVNTYSSGEVEEIRILDFREYRSGFDYNADGDYQDRIKIRKVIIDHNLYSEHIQVLSDDGAVLQDFGDRVARVPRRIQMPAGVPSFLRFSGDIDGVKIQVAATGVAGEYQVKVDKSDTSVQFIIHKHTYDGERMKREELEPGYFERAPLVNRGAQPPMPSMPLKEIYTADPSPITPIFI